MGAVGDFLYMVLWDDYDSGVVSDDPVSILDGLSSALYFSFGFSESFGFSSNGRDVSAEYGEVEGEEVVEVTYCAIDDNAC